MFIGDLYYRICMYLALIHSFKHNAPQLVIYLFEDYWVLYCNKTVPICYKLFRTVIQFLLMDLKFLVSVCNNPTQ